MHENADFKFVIFYCIYIFHEKYLLVTICASLLHSTP